jgi:hypothetical protein
MIARAINILELSYKIVEEVESVCKKTFGETYRTQISTTTEMFTLLTDHFILNFSIKDTHFFLTFITGQTGKNIANLTSLLLCVLERSEFTLLEDSYFDNVANKLVFGVDAIESKHRDTLESAGKRKCPMCDRIFMTQFFSATGMCIVCEQSQGEFVWN